MVKNIRNYIYDNLNIYYICENAYYMNFTGQYIKYHTYATVSSLWIFTPLVMNWNFLESKTTSHFNLPGISHIQCAHAA